MEQGFERKRNVRSRDTDVSERQPGCHVVLNVI